MHCGLNGSERQRLETRQVKRGLQPRSKPLVRRAVLIQKIREQIWRDIGQLWRLGFPVDEGFIAYDIVLALQEGRNVTQRELAQKRKTTLYKVRKVQRKLKAAGMIEYNGNGRNGKWKLVDSVNE